MRRVRRIPDKIKTLRSKYNENKLGKYHIAIPGLYTAWSKLVSRFDTIEDAVGYAREYGYKIFRVLHYEDIDDHTVREVIDFKEVN